jgi:serine/threonine protein kinase
MSRNPAGDYEILSKLGQGSFGVVFKCRHKKTKQIYVLKTIDTTRMN